MKTDYFQNIIEAKFDFRDPQDAAKTIRSQLMQLSLALRDLRASLLLCDLAEQLAEDSECQSLFLEGLTHLELSRLSIKRAGLSMDN